MNVVCNRDAGTMLEVIKEKMMNNTTLKSKVLQNLLVTSHIVGLKNKLPRTYVMSD